MEVVAEIKRVFAEAEINGIKVFREGKQRQEWFEEADLAPAVEEASGGKESRRAVEEETAMTAQGRGNERNCPGRGVME
jgi:hypothetical protein